jgi:hypothetical protein
MWRPAQQLWNVIARARIQDNSGNVRLAEGRSGINGGSNTGADEGSLRAWAGFGKDHCRAARQPIGWTLLYPS